MALFCRDEDHLALFIELLGHMPRRICCTGKYAKDYFNRHGELRHIKKLRFWPLSRVLQEKYEFPVKEVRLPPARVGQSCQHVCATGMLLVPWRPNAGPLL